MALTIYANKAEDGAQPRTVHAGVNTVVSTCTWGTSQGSDSATAEAGDVINFVKLPNGATVTRVAYKAGRAEGAFDLGTSATATLFADSASALTTLAEATSGIPYTVSISDDAAVAYEYLKGAVTTAGHTAGDTITVICEYIMDN